MYQKAKVLTETNRTLRPDLVNTQKDDMARIPESEYKAKMDKFVAYYVGEAKGNGSLACRMVGYKPQGAAKFANKLLNEPYVKEKLSALQYTKMQAETDSYGSIDEIFSTVGPAALANLAESAKTDTDSAAKFIKLKMDYEKNKEEDLGQYENLSTAEIVRELDKTIQEAEEIKARVVEEIGTPEMRKRPDVPVLVSPGGEGSQKECVGGNTSEDFEQLRLA